MATPPQKKGKGAVSPKKSKGKQPPPNVIQLLSVILHAIGGSALCYFLYPIQDFASGKAAGTPGFLLFISALLAGFGALPLFRKSVHTIALVSLPVLLLQITSNILLTYKWAESSELLIFLARGLTIPTGILWYFILKYKSEDIAAPDTTGEYKLSTVYKGLLPKIAGAVILVVCAFLFFYRLGYYDIWEDENLVINAAKGFYENGFAYFKEGYDRAWLHTLIVSGSFHLFGISEWAGRFPSAVFGLAFVLICFYVFARWFGLAWLAILIPLICLMNDRFLILFRYMRMYALLIPLFLAGVYLMYRAVLAFQQRGDADRSSPQRTKWLYVAVALVMVPLMAHVHKLSMILLPVAGFFILYQVLLHPSRRQMQLLWIALGGGVLLLFFTFVVQLDAMRMFRQVANRIFSTHQFEPDYFGFVFENGLPLNSTLMFLLAGLGLLESKVSRHLKSLLILNYLFIIVALISMVYLIGNEGRDYRYIAHIVPFVVCTLLLVVYYCGQAVWKGSYPWSMIFVLGVSSLFLVKDYKLVYERHPWAPFYSLAYATLKSQYKPGDAIFAQNIKTYYLDPVALAGTHYHKISKKSDYLLDQFLADIQAEGHGWVIWELHKAHHWQRDILEYIYDHFKPIHNSYLDDLGVELFYFDETMITPQ